MRESCVDLVHARRERVARGAHLLPRRPLELVDDACLLPQRAADGEAQDARQGGQQHGDADEQTQDRRL
jgi:hypothetical protein